ncbi:hypothetical protein RSAG8_13582, partial [Rhizoctonia solani AG-8 WAC10335]
MSRIQKEVDIIFVGGGTAACVTAGRLAKANPELDILLVEQGQNNFRDPNVITPALSYIHIAPGSKTASFWQGNKSTALNGRSPIVLTGRMLGGGSRWASLFRNIKHPIDPSYHQYQLPKVGSDFDDWKTDGWSSKDILPLLRKMETYHIAPDKIDKYPAVAQAYLEVAQKRGVPLVKDKHDLDTGHGCQRWAKWVNPVTGTREDAAHRYIHPLSDNKHLHIMTATKVVHVLFNGTEAIGVEVVADKDTEEGADQNAHVIKARKLVVVSAGALGSPVVLQRSGVGEAERLKKLGTQVVADLPVGSTFNDHNNRDPEILPQAQAQFSQGKGGLTTDWIDAGSKLRPTPKELEEIGPAFAPPVMLQALIEGWFGRRDILPHKGARTIMLGNYTGYPISQGHVYITSTDPYAAPDFETGYFNEQADVDVHIWGYKHAREIVRRMPQYRGEFVVLHPNFPEGSAAACVKLDGPPDVGNVKDIVYTSEDNKAIEAWLRQSIESTWHPIGTVLMKPKEQGGCVDGRLNVHGTQNLKVADLSIEQGHGKCRCQHQFGGFYGWREGSYYHC